MNCKIYEDFTASLDLVDIPVSAVADAAKETDRALQSLRAKPLAERLAQLIPEGLCRPQLVDPNGEASDDVLGAAKPGFYYRPKQQALLAAAALSSLQTNLDGGEGFGYGANSASELPEASRPASLDPLFGPLGRSPVARARDLDASQYLRLAVSGAVCSALVRAMLQPLDVVKVTQQLSAPKQGGVVEGFQQTASELMRESGLQGLYKGTGATLLATSVAGFTSFGLNELFRRSLERSSDLFSEGSTAIVLAASISSVFVSALLACPFETLRVRVMAPTERRPLSDVLLEGLRDLPSLWAGLVPFWAREIPFSACKFLVFDLAARLLAAVLLPEGVDSSFEVSALAGAIAGLASAVVSNPADVIRSPRGRTLRGRPWRVWTYGKAWALGRSTSRPRSAHNS